MSPDETIASYHNWLYKIATQLISASSPHLDDLVQEGRLAMWLAMESYTPSKGSLPAWLTRKARYRMLDVARKSLWTNQPPVSLDEVVTTRGKDTEVTLADTIPDKSEPYEKAEMAYYRAEIAAARRSLTPAQQIYVAARFYDQLTQAEMVRDGIFDYDPSALWNRKNTGAKHRLARKLAHLKGM